MAILLIDTYSAFFRAFHALPPMNTRSGEPTSAVYGLSVLLLKLLREERPQGCTFAVDRPEPTFRHEAYAAYKGTRDAAPSDLRRQFGRLDQLIEALGFPRFSARGFEADDVLATLAAQLSEEGSDALIASGDRDLLQLVGPRVNVLFLGQRGKPPVRYDEAAVRARFGIAAGRLPLYAAMLGDTSDNIPKVKGIGPTAAAKIASHFPDADSLLTGLDELGSPRLAELVRAHAQQIRESEQLVRLRRDVPLAEGVRHAALTPTAIAQTRALFEELEFRSLIPRLEALAPQ